MTEPEDLSRMRIGFASAVVLTKAEVFELCELLAEGERALVQTGRLSCSVRVASLFEMIESRAASPDSTLSAPGPTARSDPGAALGVYHPTAQRDKKCVLTFVPMP